MNEAREKLRELIFNAIMASKDCKVDKPSFLTEDILTVIDEAIKEDKIEGVGVCEGCEHIDYLKRDMDALVKRHEKERKLWAAQHKGILDRLEVYDKMAAQKVALFTNPSIVIKEGKEQG